jgi:outer membrane protein OmpA-like peptidoglycan-associated protein
MRNRTIRTFAAIVIGAAAFVAVTAAAQAAGSGDPAFVYSSKETVGQAQGILQHLKLLAPGSYQQGSLDAATREALRKFQWSHNLRQTATLDWETMTQLLPHRPGKDSDGDGVPDALDKCPNTPKGAKVDAKGCPIDSDGDGVAGGLDKCPATPKGVKVDREGCPVDSDRDGVFDGPDKCPDTPRGAKVDATGCPIDSDGDGVPDGIDKCPGTPKGIKVNGDGCPIDSDGDGVTDDKDKCPDTPRAAKVDANGCPVEAPKPAVFEPGKRTLVLEGVNFATNSARLTKDSDDDLDRVTEALTANPEVRVEVGGHTDNTGTVAINTKLSKERARAVVDYLIAKGIAPSRLESKGYGSTQPVADNGTAAGRARNRRVELKQID